MSVNASEPSKSITCPTEIRARENKTTKGDGLNTTATLRKENCGGREQDLAQALVLPSLTLGAPKEVVEFTRGSTSRNIQTKHREPLLHRLLNQHPQPQTQPHQSTHQRNPPQPQTPNRLQQQPKPHMGNHPLPLEPNPHQRTNPT